MENDSYIGKIKMFNDKYGFIKSEIGNVFFHRQNVKSVNDIKKGILVSFQI